MSDLHQNRLAITLPLSSNDSCLMLRNLTLEQISSATLKRLPLPVGPDPALLCTPPIPQDESELQKNLVYTGVDFCAHFCPSVLASWQRVVKNDV